MNHASRHPLQRHPLPSSSQRLATLALAAALTATLAACGGGGSSPASQEVAVAAPLAILAQPLDSQVTAGTAAQFSISTSGQGQTYQWQRSADGGVNWQDIAGATAATLQLANVGPADNGQLIRALITQSGASMPSAAVKLTVTAAIVAPAISIAPADVTAIAGTDASFTTTATGTSLAYRWQRSGNGTDWADIAGQTQPTLTLAALALDGNGSQVRVVVSNTAGSITSAPARLSVQAASTVPSISNQPAAASVVAPDAASFTVVASGQPAPTYQWQRSTDGGSSYVDIAGATAASYSTGATSLANNGERLRVRVSNSAGNVLSESQVLTVTAAQIAPTISQQPLDQSVTAGQAVTLTSAADGTPSPTLQWQVSLDGGSTWANINGATGGSYVFTASTNDDGRRYRVVATNSKGSVSSRGALLTVTATSALANRAWTAGERWVSPDATATTVDQGLDSKLLEYAAKSVIDQQGRVTTVFAKMSGGVVHLAAMRVVPGTGSGVAQVGAPVVIDTGAPADVLAEVTLAVSPNGNAVAGWSVKAACTAQTYDTSGTCKYLYIARYLAATGQWQAPTLLADTPTTEHALLINNAGDVLARYYSVKPATTGTVYSALAWRGYSQGAWQRNIYDLESGFTVESILLDAAGRFTAAGRKVQAGGSRNYDLAVVRGSVANGASPVEVVDQRGATVVFDGLFGNSAGQQVLMWHQDNGVRISQYAATLDDPAGAWQVADLGVTPPVASAVPGALAEDGGFQWYSFSTLRCSTQRRVAGVWGVETALPAVLCQGAPKTAIAGNGDVLALRTTSTTAGQWLSFDARLQKLMHSPATTPVAGDYLFGLQGMLAGDLLLASNGIGAFVSVNKYDVLPTAAAPNGDSRGLNGIWGLTLR